MERVCTPFVRESQEGEGIGGESYGLGRSALVQAYGFHDSQRLRVLIEREDSSCMGLVKSFLMHRYAQNYPYDCARLYTVRFYVHLTGFWLA